MTNASNDPRIVIRNDITGEPLAKMVVPEGWEARGLILNLFQGIDKPFMAQVLAMTLDDGAMAQIVGTQAVGCGNDDALQGFLAQHIDSHDFQEGVLSHVFAVLQG